MKTIPSFIPVLVVGLAAIIPFLTIFQNDFVWDDHRFIEENIYIHSLENLPIFFQQDVDGLYRPLRTVWYAFNFSIWKFNPVGYHLNGILLHALASLLVYFILVALFHQRSIA